MAITAPGSVSFGMQLPIQTLTRTLIDEWETTATVDDLVTIAQAADAAGFDFISVCDHVAVPDNDYCKHMSTTWYDTVATLAFLAAHTQRVHLASTVLVAGYRHPLLTGKAWSTLDHLSGGRAILGLGIGHVEAEFDALGVDYRRRGKLLDEVLQAIAPMFDADFVSHDGDEWSYDNVGVGPAPVRGRLTTWVAGGGSAALRRVGQFADGFIPFLNSPDDYPTMIATITEWAEKSGRGDTIFDIGVMPPWMYIGDPPEGIGPYMLSGPSDAIVEELIRERDLGANTFHLKFRARSAAEYADQIDAFATDIAPHVRSGA